MRVLISGGGIAGLTVANFLFRQGHQPIIIDKAHAFSNAGFVLSLKSFGVEIMRELGLEDKLRSIATKSHFVNFYKKDGALVRELSFEVINKNMTDSVMATRGGIHQVIFDDIREKVEIRLGTSIQSLTQNEKEVTVTLSGNSILQADLLIVSEGLRSTTRSKVWNVSPIEDFNIFYAAGRLQGSHPYKPGHIQTYHGLKKMLAILPLTDNELAIQCYIHNTADIDNAEAIKNGILSDTFRDYASEVTDLIKKLETKSAIFSDKIGMVHEPVLYKGRIVLLGDAGYCPTGLSGMGASMSIYGAKALVHFIEQSPDDLNKALNNFNSLMQPIILKYQGNARKNAKTFLPMSPFNLSIKNTILKYIPNSFITKKMNAELTLTEAQRNFKTG